MENNEKKILQTLYNTKEWRRRKISGRIIYKLLILDRK